MGPTGVPAAPVSARAITATSAAGGVTLCRVDPPLEPDRAGARQQQITPVEPQRCRARARRTQARRLQLKHSRRACAVACEPDSATEPRRVPDRRPHPADVDQRSPGPSVERRTEGRVDRQLRARHLHAAAHDGRRADRPVQRRLPPRHRDVHHRVGRVDRAGAQPQPMRGRGDAPREPLGKVTRTFQGEPDRARRRLQPRARVAQHHVDVGQRERSVARRGQQPIDRAHPQFATDHPAAQPHTIRLNPGDVRPCAPDAEREHHAPRGKVGRRRIADTDVAQFLATEPERRDAVTRGYAPLGESAIDEARGDRAALDP